MIWQHSVYSLPEGHSFLWTLYPCPGPSAPAVSLHDFHYVPLLPIPYVTWQGPLEEGRADDDMSDRLFMSPRSDLDPGTAPAGAHRYECSQHLLHRSWPLCTGAADTKLDRHTKHGSVRSVRLVTSPVIPVWHLRTSS